jgi:hypothetical protein
MNTDMASASPEELIRRLGAEYSEIGPGAAPGEGQSWYRWVPDVHAESMQLARQLKLI